MLKLNCASIHELRKNKSEIFLIFTSKIFNQIEIKFLNSLLSVANVSKTFEFQRKGLSQRV